MIATRAAAQISGSVGIDSDYRLRGYSLTDYHPAVSAQLAYDHASGFYIGLSALAELRDGARFLGVIGNIGYAKRLTRHLSVDAGVLRSQIRAAEPDMPGFRYTEVYAGAYVGPVAGRVYYSPDYRQGHQSTLYAELEAGVEPIPKWRVSGHLGLLTYLSSSVFARQGESRGDWRVNVARQLGRFELHAAVSRGDPSVYYGYRHTRAALTLGASVSF